MQTIFIRFLLLLFIIGINTPFNSLLIDNLNKKSAVSISKAIRSGLANLSNVEGNDSINQNDYSEFTYGKFARSFSLPDDVKHDGIKASMKDGVLALEIPRMEKIDPKVQRISIK